MAPAFVVSVSDLVGLVPRLRETWKDDVIICSSAAELPLLARAESVYFVVSQISMCSTAFQQLVLETLALVEESRRKLFRLDDVRIPIGFRALRFLPEGPIGRV
jgi:hypothetical protein